MIDILIPVLDRPQNAQTVVDSIHSTTVNEHAIVFICSPEDEVQIDACHVTGERTEIVDWEPGRADYAKKINWGFEHTQGEWVFSGGDDLSFQPGWDTAALEVAAGGFEVIGTNDLHNPSVLQGTHATHMLFSRSYIESQGGTADDTGAVFSEVYDHQFIDNEFNQVAKWRSTWVFAQESVVEHLHPVWGIGEWDATYNKAFRDWQGDQKIHAERMKAARRQLRYTRSR